MTQTRKTVSNQYTCNEYREEMILLGLRQQLHNPDLSQTEREQIMQEIERLEKKIGF